jgi:DegV family protein with EDD domain
MIAIVTDTSAHIPQHLIETHGIEVIPLWVRFGEKAFREGTDLTNKEFFALLRQNQEFPSTSQPSAGEFLELYSKLLDQGKDIISIHLSSKLSGTVSSARSAAEMLPGAKITVIDSLWVSMPMGWVVLAAVRAAAEGQPYEEVVGMVERLLSRVGVVFVVDTLEYLRRGGRIGGAACWVGTLLNVKPLLELRDGRVEPLARVRNKKAAQQRMLDEVSERVKGARNLRLAVLHADAPEEARQTVESVRALFPEAEMIVAEIGPAISSHTGPNTLGLAYSLE